jgi:predicted phage terminase large subunit-like protein
LKRNHFYESFQSSKYNKIIVDYKKGLAEGRITQKQVDLMKNKPFFDVLYECKFPENYGIIINKEEQLIFTTKGASECDLFAIGTDLAISEKEGADFSGIVVSGRVKGTNRVKVISARMGHWSMDEMLNLVKNEFDFYNKYATTIVGVEDVGYQRVFGEELERRFLLSPVYVKRVTDKRSRMLMLNPYFVNNQIEFYGDKNRFEDLLDQLLNFETVEHDDLADAFEMSVSLLKDFLIKLEKKEEPLPEEKAMLREAISRLTERKEIYESYNF